MQLEVIGKFIAKLRREKKLTQKQLGEMLNIDSKTISKWERGKYAPDMMFFRELGKLFEVSIEELLDGKRKEGKGMNNDVMTYSSNSETKNIKKCFIIFLILNILIILSLLIIIILQNNKQWNIINVNNSNSEKYTIDGMILYNKHESIYILREFIYSDDKIGTSEEIEIQNIKVSLLLDEKIINSNYMEYDQGISLFYAIQQLHIYVNEKKYIYNNKKELKLRIEYKDIDNNYHSETIQIK